MMTMKQLLKQRGKIWDLRAGEELPSEIVLLWHAAGELASMLELVWEPDDAQHIAPAAVEVIRGTDAYFRSISEPRHQAVAMFLLALDRVNAGLSARGDETTRPN